MQHSRTQAAIESLIFELIYNFLPHRQECEKCGQLVHTNSRKCQYIGTGVFFSSLK